MDIYIYYKSKIENADLVVKQVQGIEINLQAQFPQLSLQLQRRPLAIEGNYTWMEIIKNVPEGFDDALEQALKLSQLPSLLSSERHTERFITHESISL